MNPADAIAVIGGGPAGLAAAYELAHHGRPPMVFEKHGILGGLARTERYKGYRFDIGGHRFFTGHPRIRALWDEVIGEDFRKVPRVSHIYYQRRFFNYPLEPFNALRNLGLWESTRVLLSYLRARLRPYPDESTLDRWVSNRSIAGCSRSSSPATLKRFGASPPRDPVRVGRPAHPGMSLRTAVVNALLGTNSAKSLIRTFDYPVLSRDDLGADGGHHRTPRRLRDHRRRRHRPPGGALRPRGGGGRRRRSPLPAGGTSDHFLCH